MSPRKPHPVDEEMTIDSIGSYFAAEFFQPGVSIATDDPGLQGNQMAVLMDVYLPPKAAQICQDPRGHRLPG